MAYISIASLKSYLGISATTDDALLSSCITRAQDAIDAYTGRWFEARTATRYYDDADILDDTLYLDADLLTVTTLSNGDSSATAITAAYYTLLPRNATPYFAIKLKSTHGGWEFDSDCWASVAGTWGWAATAPDDVAQATLRMAAYMYRSKDSQVFDVTSQPELGQMTIPQGMPADVKLLLAPYRRA